jgi:integrase
MAEESCARAWSLATTHDHQWSCGSRRAQLDRRTVQPVNSQEQPGRAGPGHGTSGQRRDHGPQSRPCHWQRAYRRAEDELDDPRSLALPDWQALCELAAALVARSADQFGGWSDVVIFAACTAARIGEVSGIQCADIDTGAWTWTVRRQTTPSPGGLVDKGTKGKRARTVPLIEEVRPLVEKRLDAVGHDPTARIFTGPRGGRITTAVLRDATHWDEVVTQLGYEHLRRHDLRHTA